MDGIEEVVSGQILLLSVPEHIEKLAQRCAARPGHATA